MKGNRPPGSGVQVAPQPAGFSTLSVAAGNFASFSAGRRGLATSSPPQFGQRQASF